MLFIKNAEEKSGQQIARPPVREQSFSIPAVSSAEKKIEYVYGLNDASPFEYVTLGGMTFHKYVYPSEKSYVDNKDKQYSSGYMVAQLTKSQADSLLQEAGKRFLVHKERGSIKFSDIIFLTPLSEFRLGCTAGSVEKFYDHSELKDRSKKENKLA